MHPTLRRSIAPTLLVLFVVTMLIPQRAEAQLMVEMKINKDTFVAYESVRATVTVHNRAGHDIVLGGPRGTSWLSFDIYRQGDLLSPRKGDPHGLGAFVLGTGKSITKTIDLGQSYPLADYGTYTISAAAYFPPLKTYFSSSKKRINISDSRPFWKQSVGVTQGRGELASFREYSLLEHRDQVRADLYVRLRDKKTPRVYCCFSLGRYLSIRKPQATIDAQNRLHVMHMTSPHLFSHSRISPEGSFLGNDYYREEAGDRPTLSIDPGGVVHVVGGTLYNPDKPQPVVEKPHSITDRPPGLPR
jgi:hypothetical protein